MVGKESVKCAKCGIMSKENSSLTFHRFPLPSFHGSLKARVWATFCFPNDNWTSNESLVKLYKQHKMLCGNHFDDSSYTSSAKMRLNKFAIPTEAQNILAQLRDEHPPKEAQASKCQPQQNNSLCVSISNEKAPQNDPLSISTSSTMQTPPWQDDPLCVSPSSAQVGTSDSSLVGTRDEISNRCCCCMAEGEHENDFGTEYVEMFKNCLNMKLGECESAVICSACVGFLREVQQFRETVADTQARLGNVGHDHLFLEETQGRSFLTKDIKIETDYIKDEQVREPCSEDLATDLDTKFKTELQYNTEYLCDWETLKDSNHLSDHNYSISVANSDEEIEDTFDDMTDLLKSNKNFKVGRLKTYSRKDAISGFVNTDFQDADQQQTENFTEQSDFEIEVEEFKIKSRQQLAVEARAAKLERKAKELEQKTKILENLSTILQNSTIVPFATYKNLSNRYDCIYCDENFTSIEILRNHIDTHNDEEQKLEALKSVQDLILRADVSCIRCKICQLRLNTLDELVQHLTKLHNIQYHDIPSTPPHNILPFDLNAEVLKCLVCDKVFKKYKILLRHMNLHYGTHLCHNCGEKFIYQSHYRAHIHFEHYVKPKQASRYFSLNEDHACPVCFRHFKWKCNMLAHLKKGHPKKKRYNKITQCGICLKTLIRHNLPRHVRNMHPGNNENATPKLLQSATKNGRLKCSICLTKFATTHGLQKHINETHREKETELCQENKPSIEGTSDANLVGIPINALNMMELPINDKKCTIIPNDNTNAMEISFDTAAEIEIESIESTS